MHCYCALHCLHLHPRDGDMCSQGSQRRCHLGACWRIDDLWQAGRGKTKCSGERVGFYHLSSMPARFFSDFLCASYITIQSATWRKGQSIPVTMCTHWEPRPRRSVQLPVFGSLNVTSGRTTPTSEGAGSRSRILGKDHHRKDQTLVRSPVVLQV